jgi:hypothetical protein
MFSLPPPPPLLIWIGLLIAFIVNGPKARSNAVMIYERLATPKGLVALLLLNLIVALLR